MWLQNWSWVKPQSQLIRSISKSDNSRQSIHNLPRLPLHIRKRMLTTRRYIQPADFTQGYVVLWTEKQNFTFVSSITYLIPSSTIFTLFTSWSVIISCPATLRYEVWAQTGLFAHNHHSCSVITDPRHDSIHVICVHLHHITALRTIHSKSSLRPTLT